MMILWLLLSATHELRRLRTNSCTKRLPRRSLEKDRYLKEDYVLSLQQRPSADTPKNSRDFSDVDSDEPKNRY